MEKNEIIKRLNKIKSYYHMSNEELLKEKRFLTDEDLIYNTKWPILSGIVEAEIEILINEL